MKNFLVVFVAFAALAGCGLKERDLVGSWTGRIQLPDNGADKDDAAKNIAQAALDAINVTIDLNEDKTFKTIGFEGTWSFAGDTLTLTPTKTLGFNVSTPAAVTKATVSKDGKSFTVQDPFNARKGTFVFTKAGTE